MPTTEPERARADSIQTQLRNREAHLASFPPDQQQLVRTLLFEECGSNPPFLGNLDEKRLERFQFAALKLSEAKVDELKGAIALAKADWRALLMVAGFGNVDAHRCGCPSKPGDDCRPNNRAPGTEYHYAHEILIQRLPAGFVIPLKRLKLRNRPPAPIWFTKSSMTDVD
jgi:hypothetical protein